MKWFYKNREERSRWLAERFAKEIGSGKSLLDVGCYNADFKQHIPKSVKYTGIDMAGQPDLFINLDQIEKLPFKDEEFDTVICADVLEHLENIHLIFGELCRVSAKKIIITLPNAYAGILEYLLGRKYAKTQEKRKNFGKYMKFYGLPLQKPEDRHRWFFSFDEAEEFTLAQASKYGFVIKQIESEYKYLKHSFIKKILFATVRLWDKNLTDRNVIILLEKK